MDMALARRGSRAIVVAGVTYRWAISSNDGASYRSRIMSSNGGELEIAGEPWFLHPALDDSDTERLRRSWDGSSLLAPGATFPRTPFRLPTTAVGTDCFCFLLPAENRHRRWLDGITSQGRSS